MIAVPATPATTTAVTSGPIQRIAVSTKKPPRRSRAPKICSGPAACNPGAPRLRAKVEISSGNQQSFSVNSELVDQLLPVGIGRTQRGDDRPRGEDDHRPHLDEEGGDGAEAPAQGFDRHQLIALPSGPLPRACACSRALVLRACPLCLGELGDQGVAGLLQLLYAGDVGDGAARRRRQVRR